MAGSFEFPPYEGVPDALPTGDYDDSEVRQ